MSERQKPASFFLSCQVFGVFFCSCFLCGSADFWKKLYADFLHALFWAPMIARAAAGLMAVVLEPRRLAGFLSLSFFLPLFLSLGGLGRWPRRSIRPWLQTGPERCF